MPSIPSCEDERAALPPERAFVLQLRREAAGEPASFTGRIEHVTSGRHTRFQSVDQAVAFIANVLRRQGDEGSNGGGK